MSIEKSEKYVREHEKAQSTIEKYMQIIKKKQCILHYIQKIEDNNVENDSFI